MALKGCAEQVNFGWTVKTSNQERATALAHPNTLSSKPFNISLGLLSHAATKGIKSRWHSTWFAHDSGWFHGVSNPINYKGDPRMREHDDDCFVIVRVGKNMVSIRTAGRERSRAALRLVVKLAKGYCTRSRLRF
jgi:hypothetical protein